MQAVNVIAVVPAMGHGPVTSFGDGAPYFPERNVTITGVTKDATGAALGACTVRLFNTATNAQEQVTISDASGNYSFIVDKTQTWYVVASFVGAPNVAGVTVNTLVGA